VNAFAKSKSAIFAAFGVRHCGRPIVQYHPGDSMASKPTQPALYEKMRSRSTSAPLIEPKEQIEPPVPFAQNEPPVEAMVSTWLRAGTAVRVPVGYVLVAAVLVLSVIVLAFTIGHRSGETAVRSKFEKEIVAATEANSELTAMDPLSQSGAPGRGALAGAGMTPRTRATQNANVQSSPSNWGQVAPKSDPRKKGLAYWVLATTNEPGAIKLAEFCRANGLETYVVSAKNSMRLVIAMPGFDLSVTGRNSAEVKSTEDKIYDIGAKWQRETRDIRNLRDAYLATF
jgi:hypothetical protein